MTAADCLTGIAVFVQAAEAGSFAAAAARLHLSRSAVGKAVARLEHRLGVRLFHRTTRQQSLTDEGQTYYEHCVRALAALDAGEEALNAGRTEPAGRLRVSVPVLFGRRCVAPVLLSLSQRYPRLDIEIAFSDSVVDLLEEDVDLAVRIGTLPGSASLAARRLGIQRMAICAAPGYLAANGRPSSVDELSDHPAIIYARSGHKRAWRIRDHDGRVREARVDARLQLDDLQAIADAAIAGVGLAWLPCWLLWPHVRDGELVLVMDGERVLATEIHAVWPQARHLPPKTRVAIDALASQIPALIGQSEMAYGPDTAAKRKRPARQSAVRA